jgi:hypothetical protein
LGAFPAWAFRNVGYGGLDLHRRNFGLSMPTTKTISRGKIRVSAFIPNLKFGNFPPTNEIVKSER